MREILSFIYLTIWSIGSLFGPSCEVNLGGIKSSREFENGFDLMAIEVSHFDKKGVPIKYLEQIRIRCTPTSNLASCFSDKTFSEKEKIIISEKRKIMDTIWSLNDRVIGGPGHRIRLTEFFKCENIIDSITSVNFPFEAQKKIPFNDPSENYKWGFTRKDTLWNRHFLDCSKGIFDTLPYPLKENQWFLIDISKSQIDMNRLFFKILESGKIEQYYIKQLNFG